MADNVFACDSENWCVQIFRQLNMPGWKLSKLPIFRVCCIVSVRDFNKNSLPGNAWEAILVSAAVMFVRYVKESESVMATVCRANSPALCRIHGKNFVISQVYKRIAVEKKRPGSYQDYADFVSEVLPLLENPGSKDSYLDHPRDVEGAMTAFNVAMRKQGRDGVLYNSPVYPPGVLREILFLRDPKKPDARDNLLNKPGEGSSYKPYDTALASYVAVNGTPVRDDTDGYYGWSDHDMKDHVDKDCEISEVYSVEEDSWQEFNGTFNEDDDSVHGLEAEGECKCGRFKGKLRVQGSVTDMIKDIMNNHV